MKSTTIVMPELYYQRIYDLVREGKYPSRSEFIRHAVREKLEREGKL